MGEIIAAFLGERALHINKDIDENVGISGV